MSFEPFNALANFLKGVVSIQDQANKVQIEQALQSLKEITFLPEEVTAVLKDISAGYHIDTSSATELASYFGRIDDSMAETLRYLDPRRFNENLRISSADQWTLGEVKVGKIKLRERISSLLTSYVHSKVESKGSAELRSEAKKVLREVSNLNKAIGNLEKRLQRRRGKALEQLRESQ